MANLQFIKKEVLTSTANNLQVTNCFNTNYDVYKIFLTKVDTSALANLRLRFIKSDDSIDSTSNYNYAVHILRSYTSSAENKSTSATYWELISSQSSSSIAGNAVEITIYNPFNSSSYTFHKTNTCGYLEASGIYAPHSIGGHTVEQSNTGFQMLLSSGNYERLEVVVYGVK